MFIKACLHHDTHEGVLGDMPWSAKQKHQFLAKEMREAEFAEENLMGLAFALTPEKEYRLKVADMLELCFFCAEEIHSGNKNMFEPMMNGITFLNEFIENKESNEWQLVKELKRQVEAKDEQTINRLAEPIIVPAGMKFNTGTLRPGEVMIISKE